MATLKGKYMPLSEANVSPVLVSSYDGQYLCVGSSSSAASSSSSTSGASSAGANYTTTTAAAAAAGKRDVRYCMGNYLGGGIAGVVYEAYDKKHARNVAIKILNPVGYKLCSPATLRRGEIIKKGVPIVGNVRGMTLENVYWVSVSNRRDLIACYVDGRNALSPSSSSSSMMGVSSGSTGASAVLRELTLEMCVSLWLLDADLDDDAHSQRFASQCEDPVNDHNNNMPHCRRMTTRRNSSSSSSSTTTMSMMASQMREERKEDDANDSDDDDDDELMMDAAHVLAREEEIQIGDVVYTIPKLPAKYKAFLQSRKTIYREIAHMHKLTGNSVSGQVGGGHENVLKLYDVLEFIQPSKSTIFLVLELAYGGELFDRIRSDNGVEESIARGYFTQLLSGVLYCHQLGIVHRDLKPENLLLSESDVLKIADFGLSAHFIAAVSGSAQDESSLLSLGTSSSSSSSYQPEMDGDSGIMTPARFRRLNSIVGSPHYVAPEVLQNARYGYEGQKADMWSIGVILYGLLVGNLPFGKELPTCPRYLKFCEWIRSLPCEPLTGKLAFEMDIFNPGPTRILGGANSPSQQEESSKAQQQQIRMAQILPSYQPTPAMIHSSSLWSGVPTPTKPPASAMSIQHASDSGNNTQNGAVGRRGSRVVTFPGWFFPAKLSPQAVFLLASLLHPDPAKRFSCEDASKSNWVIDLMQ